MTDTRLMAFFLNNLDQPAPERLKKG